jgi:alpha-tubulin suppressor-like RCC1 family protein
MLNSAKWVLVYVLLIPAKVSFAQNISASGYHSLFLCADGTVRTCGYNEYGVLGDSNSLPWRINPYYPQNLPPGIIKAATGSEHSLFLKNDGTVWSCGANFGGRLGDGTTIERHTVVQATSLNGITAIAAGDDFSMFLRNDSTVWVCGNNTYGQLGDGTTSSRSTPIQVPGLSGIIAIAAGAGHALYLKSDGTVWGCGRDYNGQLGDYAHYVDRHSPVLVSSVSNVKAIAAGGSASLFLKNDSTVWGCGDGSGAQLGSMSGGGQFTDHAYEDTVLSGIIGISTVGSHSLFLKSNGTVWGCGSNYYGQLGLGANQAIMLEVQLPGVSGIISIMAGTNRSFFIKNDSTVFGCGQNAYGELEDGTNALRNTVVQIPGFSSVTDISGRGFHTLIVKSDGTVLASGRARYGQLGDNVTLQRNYPVQVTGLTNIVAVSGFTTYSLFLRNDGTVWACGQNGTGQMGDGTVQNRAVATQTPGLSNISAIAAGAGYAQYGGHSVFLKNDGTVLTCGINTYGQLGDGTTIERHTPVQIPGLTGVTAIAGYGSLSMFLKNDGTVWGCGANSYGVLGDSTTTHRSSPVQVHGMTNVVAVSTSGQHSLFLKSDGTVWACGRNQLGQLGDGTTTDRLIPVQINSLQNVIAISAGGNNSVFLKSDGTVWACGSNYYGQLGDGTTTNRNYPVQVQGLSNVVSISSGGDYSLFHKNDGTVWGIGYNYYGYLGDGTNLTRYTVVQTQNLCSVFTVCNAPTSQASNITFSTVTSNSMQINWTNGNGSRRIVKIKTSNSFTAPVNGVDYIANPAYLGGEQTIYNGTGNSVTVTGLSPHTLYWFRVYEASCSASNSLYLTSTATGNPKQRITAPASPSMNPNRPEAEEETEEISSFEIYPNPARNEFEIKNAKCKIGRLDIYNMLGEEVHSQQINCQLFTVNCQLKAGVYFVKVSSEYGVEVKRLVIE